MTEPKAAGLDATRLLLGRIARGPCGARMSVVGEASDGTPAVVGVRCVRLAGHDDDHDDITPDVDTDTLTAHLRHTLAVADQLAGEVARLRAVVQAAIARADAAEARCDALEERLTTADVPWRVPGCQCPSDSKPGDRCDARWSRCSARITYLRAVKTTENL